MNGWSDGERERAYAEERDNHFGYALGPAPDPEWLPEGVLEAAQAERRARLLAELRAYDDAHGIVRGFPNLTLKDRREDRAS